MKRGRERESQWTESIAVGSEAFVRDTKKKMSWGSDLIIDFYTKKRLTIK